MSSNQEEPIEQIKKLGFTFCAAIDAQSVKPDPSFLFYCTLNHCGCYGKNHTCPPLFQSLEASARQLALYTRGILVLYEQPLEDTLDTEGMELGRETHAKLMQKVYELLKQSYTGDFLLIGANACSLCAPCAAAEGQPCRFPERAFASMEAYGLDVDGLLQSVGYSLSWTEPKATYCGLILLK